MSKNELKKSALIVLSIHIAFMLYAFLPIFKPLKDISPLSGMKLNIVYQLVLIIAIVVTLKGYLSESWKNLLSRGLWKNIKAIILGILIIIALLYAWRFIDYFLTGFRYDINGANQDAVEGMATRILQMSIHSASDVISIPSSRCAIISSAESKR